MKYLKIIIVIGILIAFFGGAKVKGWLNFGVDAGVNALEKGVDNIKENPNLKPEIIINKIKAK